MSSEVRLIDANALKTVLCASKCGVIDPATCECGCMDVMCINDAPTIDAIPVKKFCKWLEKCRCNIFKEAFVINVQLFRAAMEKGEKK